MENTDNKKEVRFDQYCKTCEFEKTAESEDPCAACLDEPARQNSHKPSKWMEKIKRVGRTK